MRTINIAFGAHSAPLRSQVKTQGFEVPDFLLNYMQRDADAITRLNVRGILSDEQASKCRDILENKIIKLLKGEEV